MRSRLLVATVIILAIIGSRCDRRHRVHAKEACRIELQPGTASAFPAVWNGKLRIHTTLELEGERIAILALFDEQGQRLSYTEWEPHERTRWTEWRDLGLGAGTYQAVFATEHCRATTPFLVN